MSQERVDRLRASYELFSRLGEYDADLLAPDFELHQASAIIDTEGVFYGPDAVLDVLRELQEAFEELSFEAEEFVVARGARSSRSSMCEAVAEVVASRSTTASRTCGPTVTTRKGLRVEAEACRQLDDERVLVLTRLSGRGKTSGIELGQMRSNGADVLEIRGGKVVRFLLYWNREHALADLGLSE
jgi:ketosteroid isomerase-like protein